jgi:PTH1 family peptidyl-tRNA hydrolase
MRLIVGLGNPGPEYAWTPHNMGFLAIDQLAEDANIRVVRPESKSYTGLGRIGGKNVVLAKPQTMMNLSGMAVRELLARYQCVAAEMILLSDEIALPWGMIRVRDRGSAGGHNGLKSVIGAIGSDVFIRVRMGIRPDHPVGDLAAYDLRPLKKAELADAGETLDLAAAAVKTILTDGLARAMNLFNKRVESEEEDSNE